MSSSKLSRVSRLGLAVLGLALVASAGVTASPDPGGPRVVPADLPARSVALEMDSGVVGGRGNQLESVWESVAGEEGAPWVRVFFGNETRLGRNSQVRITSLYDGAVQHLDAQALRQWGHSSAYFNGSQVLVELMSARGHHGRVVIDGLWAGIPSGPAESICGSDDRVLSSDPRVGRMLAGGCTAWLVNECFLSAGHCMSSNTVVQFNVPLSSSSGSVNHPPPSDQYTIDTDSRQWVNCCVGNDWGYFGVFPNTETGLTALAAQGDRFLLATEVPVVAGQTIRITGHGTDSTPPEHNQVQQTDAGPYRELFGTTVRYETDTTGGSSGSAVFDEPTGRAIGIHTDGGCDTVPPPYNQGTALNNESLQLALRNPLGRCATQAACNQNGVCEAGEDCFNCVTDCVHAPPGGSGGAVCGNDVCEVADGENCTNCSIDCNSRINGRPADRFCCGDDVGCGDARCTGGGNTCSTDPAGGNAGYCCGDGVCEGDEDAGNCGVDCTSGCTTNTDCDDLNECTDDVCEATGLCLNSPLSDGTACGGGAGMCCMASCSVPACEAHSDCDDADACTVDTCVNPGSCSAACDNAPSGDPSCCVATHSKEKGSRCSDGIDNDCDGATDGADTDC